MKKFTAKDVNESPNEVYNEATKAPVLIEHKRRGAEFVLCSKNDWDNLKDHIEELGYEVMEAMDRCV